MMGMDNEELKKFLEQLEQIAEELEEEEEKSGHICNCDEHCKC